jgi:hypothetical protein
MMGTPAAALTFFSHSNRPCRARVTAQSWSDAGYRQSLASAIHTVAPAERAPHAGGGWFAAGSEDEVGLCDKRSIGASIAPRIATVRAAYRIDPPSGSSSLSRSLAGSS